MKSIAFHTDMGGAGSTTNAAHLCFFAADLGLRVVGVSVGGPGDLRHWLRLGGLPYVDGRRENIPRDVDLVVFDVYSNTHYHEVLRPALWLISVDNSEADRRAVNLAPKLHGKVLRLRNFRHGLGCELSPELENADSIIPRCQALAATDGSWRPVWSTPSGAYAAGTRALRELGAEALARVGLLVPEWAPAVRDEPTPEIDEIEALGRLKDFFVHADGNQ